MDIDYGATEIVETLKESGFIAYLAGGCVRDYLLGISSSDIDIATDASLDEICALFPKCILVGAAFGVAVVMMDGRGYEVATFRSESGYSDGRHPDHVEKADPQGDSFRRDFTINGMFFDPSSKEVIDYVDGRADLKKGVIRAIGNPTERLEEDRLRALRAVRFASRFNFEIEPETKKAVAHVACQIPASVSVERIVNELTKMAGHTSFPKALVLLWETGLLKVIFPEIDGDIRGQAEQMENVDLPLELKLIGLFMHLNAEKRTEIFERLKLSRKALERIEIFHAHEALDFEVASAHERAHLLAKEPSELCTKALSVHLGEKRIETRINQIRSDLDFHIEALKKKKPLVRADDLLKKGIKPGPLLGELLRDACNLAIDHDIRDKQELLEQMRKMPLWPSKRDE